ncbi:MAG: (2Fe-2S)-binding protein [Oligoflexia bacterium]|nr:(2Fe-2S)-binding protein [Oligoflexia bacterium]
MQSFRVEIKNRCWVEASFKLDEYKNVLSVDWHAQGSFDLIQECEKFFKLALQKNLESLSVVGVKTAQLMLNELLDKAKGVYKSVDDIEICHCRKINRSEIIDAILLGAHTPEKVKKWTTASSGCGTCRSDVDKLINELIKRDVSKS